MSDFEKDNRIEEIRQGMLRYVSGNYLPPATAAVSEPAAEYFPEKEFSLENLTPAEARALGLLLDERKEKSFSELLVQYVNERGEKDSVVYQRAQIDRRLYSKIMGDREYRPAKDTVIALALALRCTPDEAKKLLGSAGYLLSRSSRRDLMIEYCFVFRKYDLMLINEALDQLGEKMIGR